MSKRAPNSAMHACVFRDEGVFTVITAVIAFVLVSAFILLAINNAMVREASVKLRAETDRICQNLALQGNLAVQADAQAQFALEIAGLKGFRPVGRVRLTEARLLMPTMFRAESPFALDQCARTPSDPAKPLENVCGEEFECHNSSSPDLKCYFQGTVDWPSDETPVCAERGYENRYPAGLWNDIDNAGNAAGCELRATVTLWTGEREIMARSVAWTPIVADYHNYLPCAGVARGSEILADVPGVTLAVATHLTTRASDSRFRFKSPWTVSSGGWDSDWSSTYDPLSGFSFGSLAAPSYSTSTLQRAIRLVPEAAEASLQLPKSIDVSSSGGQAQYEEMLAACMNPVVLVRNALLATIVEVASRNGQLRGSTEILHIGTQHRNVTDAADVPVGYSSGNTALNGPAMIVPLGADLVDSVYFLPYVYYFSGDNTNQPPAAFGPPRYGWIDPLVPPATSSTLDPATLAAKQDYAHYYALIAGQLRYCYMLYNNNRTSAPGISRFKVGLAERNDHFEPALYSEQAAIAPEIPTAWDQCFNTCTADEGAGAKAADVVAMLGSTQMCPYPDVTALGNPTCAKPPPVANPDGGIGTFDLRPDMLGLFAYLSGEAAAGWPKVYAYSQMGLMNPAWEDIPPRDHLSAHALPLEEPRNTGTAIIVVTHQRLSTSTTADYDEVLKLKALTDPNLGAFAKRPIIVVYIPAERTADETKVAANFAQAFSIPGSSASGEQNRRQLVMLSPYNPSIRPGTPEFQALPESCRTGTESDCFRDYWTDVLLNPENPKYIVKVATQIFNMLLNPEQKL